MIQPQTVLKVADNSGGKFARCLKVLKKGAPSRYGRVGDFVVLSIIQLRNKNRLTSKVRRGDVVKGVVVKTQSVLSRPNGLSFRFQQNAVVLVDKQFKPLATRVLGVIPRELKAGKFSKILSLSAGTV